MDPDFFHAQTEEIPSWETDGVHFKLVAGEAFGHKSPVPVYSKLFLLEIKSAGRKSVNIGEELFGEAGLYILEGSIESEGNSFDPKRILVAKNSQLCEFTMEANTTVYIFGGEPFPEERIIYWNFVATNRNLIETARQNWQDGIFPVIEGETDIVPLPVNSSILKPKQ